MTLCPATNFNVYIIVPGIAKCLITSSNKSYTNKLKIMKIYSLLPALTILTAGLFAGFGYSIAQPVKLPAKTLKSLRSIGLIENSKALPGLPLLQKNIDLAAESINFSVVNVMDRFNAVVKIEGVVRNVGRLNYTSGTKQQSALLYEDNGGILRLVASQSFQNLDVNATAKVSFTRNWNKASEFPPNYILIISFDPDIYMDANTNNDDANNANNKFSRSGGEINLLSFKR